MEYSVELIFAVFPLKNNGYIPISLSLAAQTEPPNYIFKKLHNENTISYNRSRYFVIILLR